MVSDVVEAVEKVLAAGKKTGKRMGSIVRQGESPKQYVDKDFSYRYRKLEFINR